MSHKIVDTIKKIEQTYTFYLTPIIIFFALVSVIFITFELSIFTVARQIDDLQGLVGIWFWEIGALSFYGGSIYLSIRIHSFPTRRIISIFLLFSSLLSVLAIIILSLINGLIMLKLFIALVGILSFVAFLMLVVEEPPELMDYGVSRRGVFVRVVVVVILLTLNISLLLYRPNTVLIEPKSNPELIFFGKSEDLPNHYDGEILNLFKNNNFSFCVSISEDDINNADTTYKLRVLLNNEINVYLMLEPTIGLYTTLENAYTIPDLYIKVREWLKSENLFDDDQLKAFLIDAEASDNLAETTADLNLITTLNYLSLNRPNETIIANASISLKNFTAMVNEDEKQHGIIKSPSFYDESDGDHDISFLFHNVYGLDITWNFSVIMSYRTEVVGGQIEVGNVSIFSDLYNQVFNFYGTIEEGKFNIISKHFFYTSVAAAQTGGEVKANERYIFIGDTQSIFNSTSYIKNKEIFDDLDICRHFNEQKVFVFLYQGFWDNYEGINGLNELANHNKQSESWLLPIEANEKNVIPIYYAIVNVFDRFAALGF